jgi:hypothetical protein
MPHKTLLAKIAKWHKARENGRIREAVLDDLSRLFGLRA